MYDIWNYRTNERVSLSDSFKSVADAWAYVRSFLNTEDYEVRPHVTKKIKRGAGRPRIYPLGRVRHNLNIERDAGFDSCLLRVRQMMAEQDGVSVDQITQKSAVTYALYMIANRLPVKLPADQTCPRCNGRGHIAIKNGDDDTVCECCGQDINTNEIPF